MTDPDLTELLERAAERTHVRPPPTQHMVAGARRTRRRHMLMLTAATGAAVVGIIVGTIALSAPDSNSPDNPQPAASSPSPHPGTPTPTETTTSTDLEGTWTVRALVGVNGQSVIPDSARGTLRLSFAHGELTGTTGCNDIGGTYKQSGKEGRNLRFPGDQLLTTLVGCTDEPPLVSRLLDVRHVSGSAGVRYLHAENWMIVAELRRP